MRISNASIILCLVFPVFCAAGTSSVRGSGTLMVRHVPNPAPVYSAPDSTEKYGNYRWRFTTEVRNNLDVPVRVTGFGAYADFGGPWQITNISGELYDSDDFTEWYQAGDPVVDGWIGAGAAAADSNNWIQSPDPMPSRFKWIYTGEDSAGNEYRAEAEIELIPAMNDGVPWWGVDPAREGVDPARWGVDHARDGVDPARLTAVTGSVVLEDGSPPAYAQVHIYHINRNARRPKQTVVTAGDGTFSLKAARPGWYRLQIYCAGQERLSFPLAIDESDEALEVAIHPIPHDRSAGREDADRRVHFDDRHRDLRSLPVIERIYERGNASFYGALYAHQEEHEGLKDFRFDASEATSLLGEYMNDENPRIVREYAAVHTGMLQRFPSRVDTATAREIFDTVPPHSLLWGIHPELASNIAGTFKRSEGREILLRIVRKNPDRLVRASTLANLVLWSHFSGNREEVARYYEELSGAYGDVEEIHQIVATVNPDRRIRSGELVPDFEIELLDTEGTVSNKSLRGSYYLVYIWSTSCGPCVREMPHLHELFEKYHESNFTILSLSIDKDREAVRRFREEKWKMPWLHGFVEGGTESDIAKSLEVFGLIPKVILVDPNGVIMEEGYGRCGVHLDETLSQRLDGAR